MFAGMNGIRQPGYYQKHVLDVWVHTKKNKGTTKKKGTEGPCWLQASKQFLPLI